MIVSKMFQPSLKYTLGSIAISFTIASIVNVAVKTYLRYSAILSISLGCSYHLKSRTIVLAICLWL
jgi:hypothetical protein